MSRECRHISGSVQFRPARTPSRLKAASSTMSRRQSSASRIAIASRLLASEARVGDISLIYDVSVVVL